uniref:Uncharacterized protein n=1 Tax=Phage sp. ctGns7 TaxID=2828003 RepID=A0A8S5S974_9VIRU|nr:MAG TPA: hypothetical protein [Phage sp. ctGns7]
MASISTRHYYLIFGASMHSVIFYLDYATVPQPLQLL